MLDVRVAKARSDNAADAYWGRCNRPDAILLSPQFVQHHWRDQQHAERIGCIVEDTIGGICEMSSHESPRLRHCWVRLRRLDRTSSTNNLRGSQASTFPHRSRIRMSPD